MKYILGFSMIGALIAAFMLIQLGFAYQDEGYGLHPYIAGIGFATALWLGGIAAHMLATLEN